SEHQRPSRCPALLLILHANIVPMDCCPVIPNVSNALIEARDSNTSGSSLTLIPTHGNELPCQNPIPTLLLGKIVSAPIAHTSSACSKNQAIGMIGSRLHVGTLSAISYLEIARKHLPRSQMKP